MKIATVGVHVLDTHVIGIESIPEGSDGQLVETIRMSPGRHRRRHGAWCSPGSAPRCSSFGAVGTDPIGDTLLALLGARGRRHLRAGAQGRPPDLGLGDPGAPERRPAGLALHRRQRRVHPRRPRPGRSSGITHLHLGGPEFLGGEAAGAAARPRALRSARPRRSTSSRPGDPDMLAWIADALPHTDYLLPNDEQVLGFTGAAVLAEGARALVAAGRRLRRRHPGREGRARGHRRRGRSRCRRTPIDGRRHHRLRRRVLGRLPARALARPRPARRRAARLRHRGPGGAGARHRRRVLRPGLGPGLRAEEDADAMRAVSCAGRDLVRRRPAGSRRPARGQLVLGRAALRDLRLRPARPRALRRPGRGDGRARLRRVHAALVAHGARPRVRRRGARAGPRRTRREFREGAHVVSFPLVRRGRDVHPIGLSPLAPGGYAEQVLVEQSMSFVVPNGLAPDVAALTEPMAVALHAVNRPRRRRAATSRSCWAAARSASR